MNIQDPPTFSAAWSMGIPVTQVVGPIEASVGFTSNGDSQVGLEFSLPGGIGRPDIGVTPSLF